MFNNIGKKLKSVAEIFTAVGITMSIIAGLVLFDSTNVITAIMVIVFGCLGSWLGSLTLYGFGELIECSQRIADKVNPIPKEIHHDGWTCPYCGEKNLLGESVCQKCGRS